MCFSASASFISSAVIGGTGAASATKVKKKEQIPLALIPIFFSIQQLFEGFVWLKLGAGQTAGWLAYGFLFFAYIIWPSLVPFAFYLIEKDTRSKKALFKIGFLGLLISLIGMGFLTFSEISPMIVNNSIQYVFVNGLLQPSMYLGILVVALYVFCVCGPGLFTSYKYLKLFTGIVFLSLVATGYFYLATWESVWCYFSATLSVIVGLHFYTQK